MKISFHSHANENYFSYEKMSTRTRFEKEAKGNSEMAYLVLAGLVDDFPIRHCCCYSPFIEMLYKKFKVLKYMYSTAQM